MKLNRMLRVTLGVTSISLIWAQGVQDVRLMPTRISLSDDKKSDSVLIANRGTSPIRYRVTLVDKEMTDNGSLVNPTKPMANSAKDYIRIAPKEISLSPGAWQKIKVLSTLPSSAPSGEYRVHLALTPIKMSTPAKASPADAEGPLKIQLEMQSAMTIPIFINHGRLTAIAKLSDVKIASDDDGAKVVCRLERSGNRTIRGNCLVTFTSERGGKPIVISEARSVPLYFPNTSRLVTMPLSRSLAALGDGTIIVQYSETNAQVTSATLKVRSSVGR